MSQFKVKFTLKQHTPIIHFQSEQHGATLRATELKPKFDRFLKEYAFNGEMPKEFLITQDKEALDYKVKIEQNISKFEEINARNPLFFGNMGDGEDKKFKFNNSSFDIEFFTFNTKLKSIIDKNFEIFLANSNFGTRQSKGFGSFYINNTPFNKEYIKHKVYSFESTPKNYQEDIKLFYAFLRAGLNTVNRDRETIFYVKAAIFAYAKSLDITWDKKAIKENYLGGYLKEQQKIHLEKNNAVHYLSANQLLMRDLMGLSTEQSWMSYKAKVTKENKDITRFKSPITFKPIYENNKMMIYFWADDGVEKILNHEFLIKFNRKGDLKLSTPSSFSFDDFFTFTFNLDLSKYVDLRYHNRPEYSTLLKIFKNIKEVD